MGAGEAFLISSVSSYIHFAWEWLYVETEAWTLCELPFYQDEMAPSLILYGVKAAVLYLFKT